MTDFKPGDKAMRGSLEAVVIAVDGKQAWVRYESGSNWTVDIRDLEPIPGHPIPSEPNTAWVDKQGDVWVVSHGEKLMPSGNPFFWGKAEDYAPFTRLVPEGSEREAAIREVVEYLADRGWESVAEEAQKHFLSGVDQ